MLCAIVSTLAEMRYMFRNRDRLARHNWRAVLQRIDRDMQEKCKFESGHDAQ